MKKGVFAILLLSINLAGFHSFGQNQVIDSLQKALADYDARKLELGSELLPTAGDSIKVQTLNLLGDQYYDISDYGATFKNAEEALSLSQQIEYKSGAAKAYLNMGKALSALGKYNESHEANLSAIKIYEEIDNKTGVAAALHNMGVSYTRQGNYAEALKKHFESLKIVEELGLQKRIASCYNSIGNIYLEQGNYKDALKYFNAHLKINEQIGDIRGISISHNNIGIILTQEGNFEEALNNFFKSLEIKKEIDDKVGIAINYENIGGVYFKQNKYADALDYFTRSLTIYEEIEDKEGMASSFNNIGSVKLKTQNAREAKEWFTKGLTVANELGALDYVKSSYEGLSSADSALGDYKGAFENHKQFILYRDSINNEETEKITYQTKMQYEFDKKEAQTKIQTDAALKKQKLVRNGFIGGFIIVLLFATVVLIQRNKTKKEKQRSDELLLNILPGEVADEIKNTGTAKAKSYTMVTVLLADFKDFTLVSEKISAELLVDEIHVCFSAFDAIIHKHRIEKIKTIGDAYLCASGLPVTNYTHAQDMIQAAFEIRSFMLNRKKEKEAKGEIPFEIRIGIHTGPVVAGVVGVKKYAYDIWGDTVNIAARMEQNSEAGKINISGATYELIKDKFKCTYRGKIEAKNKGQIDMYFVES